MGIRLPRQDRRGCGGGRSAAPRGARRTGPRHRRRTRDGPRRGAGPVGAGERSGRTWASPGGRLAPRVRVGELFRDAVRLNATGLILVHNHPSGDPTPSPDDLRLTAEALAAGRLLDIQLPDPLLVAGDSFVSLRDRGVAFDRPS